MSVQMDYLEHNRPTYPPFVMAQGWLRSLLCEADFRLPTLYPCVYWGTRLSKRIKYGKSINQITNRRIFGRNRWPDKETRCPNPRSFGRTGLQERQELLHDSWAGQDCSAESQSSYGSKSSN